MGSYPVRTLYHLSFTQPVVHCFQSFIPGEFFWRLDIGKSLADLLSLDAVDRLCLSDLGN